MPVTQRLRKAGHSYVVTVPREEVERLHLTEGQLLTVEVHPVELRPVLDPELRAAFEASWNSNAAGYLYLADR